MRDEIRPFHESTITARPLEDALAEIDGIARIGDAPLRNLLITQAYCDLSHGIATVTGSGNANWSSFAAWASKTAGQTIRGEEVPREIASALRDQGDLERRLARLEKRVPALLWLKIDLDVFDVARAAISEVSEQIAAGNLKVFAELAPFFARFVHDFSDPQRRTPEDLQSFLAPLAPGSASTGGQDSLRLAFTSYLAAAGVTTSKERAELILYANLLIGLHEQTRLQPQIQASIDAPFSPKVYRTLAAGKIWALPVFRWLFERQLKLVFHAVHETWERIITRHMMRLALPHGESVPLGQDLRVAGRPFPPDLDPLHHPALIALVRTYDRNLDTLEGSGARNWTSLGDRMAFIADLFRSSQCDASMFDAPFTPAQIEAFRAGKVPAGPL
jgi:hypothetical protein